MQNLSLKTLDIIAEEKPAFLLQNIEVFRSQQTSGIPDSCFTFFKAKALISVLKPEEAEPLIIDLLGKAVQQSDYYLLVRCNILLSKCFDTQATRYNVMPCVDLAEEYAQASGDLELLAEVYSIKGFYSHKYGLEQQALEYHQKAVLLSGKIPACLTSVNALMRMATLYRDKQDFLKAIDYLSRALEISQKAGIEYIQLSIINNLATACNKLKKYAQAEELLHKGIALCKARNLPQQNLRMLFNLGIQKNLQLQYVAAIEYYDQCTQLAMELHYENPAFLTDLYNNYSCCYWLLKQADPSIEYLNKAEAIAQQSDNPGLSMQIAVNKTNILIETGKYEEAREILLKAVKYYKAQKNYANLLVVQRNLALLYARQQKYNKSIQTYQDTDKIYEKYISQLLSENADLHKLQMDEVKDRCTQTYAVANQYCQPNRSAGAAEFIGQSTAHRNVLNSALLAAQHMNTNVFIMGESGTGKEVIASIIHQNSIRRSYPFVPINSSALSAGLVESEFFGHKKGAFTGAVAQTKGFFVQAHKGTLFLDEITEMPYDLQAKLLRALETRKITPVGSSVETPFDCRIISSTNHNINALLQTNQFRLDLFHRLNTIEIYIPPLRERPEDIEILLNYFMEKYALENKHSKPRIDQSFLDRLLKHPFPGNVRELKNIIERLFIMHSTSWWDAGVLECLNDATYGSVHAASGKKQYSAEEAEMIIKALLKTNGKQKEAARLLNMTASTICRKIAKHHLESYTHKGK